MKKVPYAVILVLAVLTIFLLVKSTKLRDKTNINDSSVDLSANNLYENDKLGFSFKYSKDYIIQDSSNSYNILDLTLSKEVNLPIISVFGFSYLKEGDGVSTLGDSIIKKITDTCLASGLQGESYCTATDEKGPSNSLFVHYVNKNNVNPEKSFEKEMGPFYIFYVPTGKNDLSAIVVGPSLNAVYNDSTLLDAQSLAGSIADSFVFK